MAKHQSTGGSLNKSDLLEITVYAQFQHTEDFHQKSRLTPSWLAAATAEFYAPPLITDFHNIFSPYYFGVMIQILFHTY